MSKLKGIKEGDRVRVTFEGKVRNVSPGGFSISPDGGSSQMYFTAAEEISQPSFTIEKLPEPLKAGDRVKWEHIAALAVQELEGEIITTYQGTAWVKADKHYLPYSVEISRLSKIS